MGASLFLWRFRDRTTKLLARCTALLRTALLRTAFLRTAFLCAAGLSIVVGRFSQSCAPLCFT